MPTFPLVAGVELGGTKCIAILSSGPDDVRDRVRIETTDPETTIGALETILARWRREVGFDAIGIACFGPLGLDRSRPDYGTISRTTKPGWNNARILDRLSAPHDVPFGFETDVNGAVLAEGLWGGARGLADHAYVTIGTGVGVGVVADHRLLLKSAHMELGHLRIPRRAGDEFPGVCHYHGDCVEGLLSGPAIRERHGCHGSELPADHPYWLQFCDETAVFLHGLIVGVWPRRIAIGGGVLSERLELLPLIAERVRTSLGGYGVAGDPSYLHDDFIGPPHLGSEAGPLGAIALGLTALEIPE